MSRELFALILKKIEPYTDYLYFHVMGEPLLHSELEYFLDLCAMHSFHANITTNGTLIRSLSDKIIRKKALRLINFSLHSLENNKHNDPNYLKNILEFAELTGKENPNLIICLRLWNYSHAVPSVFNKNIIKEIKDFFNYPHEIQEIPQQGNGLKLRKNLYLSQSERFEWPNMKLEDIGDKGFCLGLRDQIAILVDGTVVPCCLDSEGSINLGNIKNSSLPEIYNSQKAQRIYNGFSSRILIEEFCRKCDYRKRF